MAGTVTPTCAVWTNIHSHAELSALRSALKQGMRLTAAKAETPCARPISISSEGQLVVAAHHEQLARSQRDQSDSDGDAVSLPVDAAGQGTGAPARHKGLTYKEMSEVRVRLRPPTETHR
jgi:hypothetical protein